MIVTVCVPAFRVGSALAQTLASVAGQTYPGWRARIAIDPDDGSDGDGVELSQRAAAPFLSDSRFEITVNARRLGWAGNVRELLATVRTPLFAILPHDDLWRPQYLQTMVEALVNAPWAGAAYGDLWTFGDARPRRKAVRLPPIPDTAAQLMAFLLEGAEAMPWRGVTRSKLIAKVGGFPTDAHAGFAVECEYALALLLRQPVLHVPQALYSKRVHPPEVASASRARRRNVPGEKLNEGWRLHAGRMRALVEGWLATADVTPDGADAIRLALHWAMLRRRQQLVAPSLPADNIQAARSGLAQAQSLRLACAGELSARFQEVLARHSHATAA